MTVKMAEIPPERTVDATTAPAAARPLPPASPFKPMQASRFDSEISEFNYRPVPVIAVVGLVLALVSSSAVLIWLALPLCALAMVCSALGLWTIKRSNGAYSGYKVALAGLVLGTTFLLSGIGFQVHMYRNEVPEGYQRLSFNNDISEKGVVVEEGTTRPHPDVAALEGKKVFLKGYIYQTGQLEKLGAFLMVKDNADCCFGGKPKLWDRLGVVMQDGKTIDYKAGKVAIAGTFRLNPKFEGNDELEPIYIIDADHFSSRVSEF